MLPTECHSEAEITPMGCGLPAERRARILADGEILRVQAEHTARLADLSAQMAQSLGALQGARSTLRVLLALAVAASAQWAPEVLTRLSHLLH